MEQSNNAEVVVLEGDLTVGRVLELKELLLGALGAGDRVVVDVERAGSVDLSCLQLLCAAHRMAMRMNKQLALGGKYSETFKRTVREAGCGRSQGCHGDPLRECLWVGGWR
jgi:anti-anti-sigma regulatory factor